MQVVLNSYILFHIVGIFALLCISFFFSCTETTLFSLSNFQVKKLQRTHPHGGAVTARLLANPRRLLISILIGNMFVNIFSSTLGESLMRFIVPGAEGTLYAILIMTFAILVMGEVTPKTIAIQCNTRLAPLVAPIINAIGAIEAPIRKIVRAVSDGIISIFTPAIPPTETAVTQDEIKTAIKIGSREGIVDAHQKEMIQGVFNFASKRVAAIMRPRKEIVAFDLTCPLSDIERMIRARELSRIPIYDKTLDNITGVIYAKDLLRNMGQSPWLDLKSILRPAYFVPETKTAASLLREFKRRKTHLAIVVDEYGGVSGLITLEDLIEEIIGEIRDKGDTVPFYQKLDDRSFRINARMELGQFNELLGASLTDQRSATIGGFLVNQTGMIPPKGYRFSHGDLQFVVSATDKSSIKEIVVSKGGNR
jgi:CBS domain containing-hemolysin-like protein